jgi:hypothetical protein
MLIAMEDLLYAGELAKALTARDELVGARCQRRRSALLSDIAIWHGRFREAAWPAANPTSSMSRRRTSIVPWQALRKLAASAPGLLS